MTTLPAKIPGLLRRGSPVIDMRRVVTPCNLPAPRGLWAQCGPKLDEGYILWDKPSGVRERLEEWVYAGLLALDLTDETGRFHAMLWLAAKFDVDASCGLHWEDDGEASWRVAGAKIRRGHCGPWIRVDTTDPIEALRLAVLAVAGVQS
jgi:hypothetical protein